MSASEINCDTELSSLKSCLVKNRENHWFHFSAIVTYFWINLISQIFFFICLLHFGENYYSFSVISLYRLPQTPFLIFILHKVYSSLYFSLQLLLSFENINFPYLHRTCVQIICGFSPFLKWTLLLLFFLNCAYKFILSYLIYDLKCSPLGLQTAIFKTRRHISFYSY